MKFTIRMACLAVITYGSVAVWDSGQGSAQAPSSDSDANVDLAIAPRYDDSPFGQGYAGRGGEVPRPARMDSFGGSGFDAPASRGFFDVTQAVDAGHWTDSPAGLTIFADGRFRVVGQDEWSKPENREKLLRQSHSVQSELQKAMNQLRAESASDAERAEAKKTISQYLEVQFDADHERRVQQLQSLEKRVATLKAQLEKRAESRDRMIELRMTLIENEAEGLGFPAAWSVQTGNMASPIQGRWLYGQQPAENGRFPSSADGDFNPLSTQPASPAPTYSIPGAR